MLNNRELMTNKIDVILKEIQLTFYRGVAVFFNYKGIYIKKNLKKFNITASKRSSSKIQTALSYQASLNGPIIPGFPAWENIWISVLNAGENY